MNISFISTFRWKGESNICKQSIVCSLTNFLDLKGNQTIINVDVASDLHNLGDVLVVEPQHLVVAFLHELVIKCDLDGFSLFQLNLSSATLNNTRREGVNL